MYVSYYWYDILIGNGSLIRLYNTTITLEVMVYSSNTNENIYQVVELFCQTIAIWGKLCRCLLDTFWLLWTGINESSNAPSLCLSSSNATLLLSPSLSLHLSHVFSRHPFIICTYLASILLSIYHVYDFSSALSLFFHICAIHFSIIYG